MPVEKSQKFDMMGGCLNYPSTAGWRMHIPSPVSARCNALMGSSVTRVLASSHSFGGEKTVCGTCGTAHRTGYDRKRRRVRDLSCADHRIYLDLEVRRVDCRRCDAVKRERVGLSGRERAAHETLCALRRSTLSRWHHPGRRRRAAFGLADGQAAGDGLYA